jgi:integral membrane protein
MMQPGATIQPHHGRNTHAGPDFTALRDPGGHVPGSPIGRLRVIGFLEGVSFLLLLGIAMPLKYLAGRPGMVSVVGLAHGLLWIAYMAAVIDVRSARGWPWSRTATAVIASLLPFGPFVFDGSLRREQSTTARLVVAGS